MLAVKTNFHLFTFETFLVNYLLYGLNNSLKFKFKADEISLYIKEAKQILLICSPSCVSKLIVGIPLYIYADIKN